MARRDEIKFVMGTRDPNLFELRKVWLETMQLATQAAGLFDESSTNLDVSMRALGTLVNGLKSAMERTRALTKGAGKVLERSYILVFRLGGTEYCFHVDTVQEVAAAKKYIVLPQMPFFVMGVMEHRETVVPIVDPALILRTTHRSDKMRLILVRKNGDCVALFVDDVRNIVPVVSGYFRPPRVDEPLLKMVYEDGTTRIRMLDPRLLLEAGVTMALSYSHNLNAGGQTPLRERVQATSSRSGVPLLQAPHTPSI
jgi:chemotaxis signal transduction protein